MSNREDSYRTFLEKTGVTDTAPVLLAFYAAWEMRTRPSSDVDEAITALAEQVTKMAKRLSTPTMYIRREDPQGANSTINTLCEKMGCVYPASEFYLGLKNLCGDCRQTWLNIRSEYNNDLIRWCKEN